MNRRVPARLVHDQIEVVVGPQVADPVATPAQLARLALDRSARHQIEFVGDPRGKPAPQPLPVLAQGGAGEDRKRISGVDRQRDTVLGVQRGPPSAQQTGVLDVVMDQERVVQKLERDRGRQRLVELAAERDGGCEAEGRPDRLPAPPGVLGDQVPQVLTRLRVGHVMAQGIASNCPVAGQVSLDRPREQLAHPVTSILTGRPTSGRPVARMCPW